MNKNYRDHVYPTIILHDYRILMIQNPESQIWMFSSQRSGKKRLIRQRGSVADIF